MSEENGGGKIPYLDSGVVKMPTEKASKPVSGGDVFIHNRGTLKKISKSGEVIDLPADQPVGNQIESAIIQVVAQNNVDRQRQKDSGGNIAVGLKEFPSPGISKELIPRATWMALMSKWVGLVRSVEEGLPVKEAVDFWQSVIMELKKGKESKLDKLLDVSVESYNNKLYSFIKNKIAFLLGYAVFIEPTEFKFKPNADDLQGFDLKIAEVRALNGGDWRPVGLSKENTDKLSSLYHNEMPRWFTEGLTIKEIILKLNTILDGIIRSTPKKENGVPIPVSIPPSQRARSGDTIMVNPDRAPQLPILPPNAPTVVTPNLSGKQGGAPSGGTKEKRGRWGGLYEKVFGVRSK